MLRKVLTSNAVGFLGAFVVLAILISAAFLVWDLRLRELEHARIETISMTRMLQEETEQAFGSTSAVLQNVQEKLQSGFGSTLALDSPEIFLLLSTRIAGSPQVLSIFIASADGTVQNSSREYPIPQISIADREYFKTLKQQNTESTYFGSLAPNRLDGKWAFFAARRLQDKAGTFRGVVVISLNLGYFEKLYELTQLDFPRPAALYTRDGRLIASLPQREQEIGLPAPELRQADLSQITDIKELSLDEPDGSKRLLTVGSSKNYPFLVSVTNEEEEALSSWRETAMPMAIGAVVLCLLITAVATWLSRELKREAALTVALREADDRYERTVDSLMDAIVAVNEHQRIILFNPAAERMFGYRAQDMLGQPLARLIPVRYRHKHHGYLASFIDPIRWQKDRKETITTTGGEAPVPRLMGPKGNLIGLRSDGSEFPIESTISQTLVKGRHQFTAVIRDITERKRVEQDMHQLNQQLRELSGALQDVREQERMRISRELHDELGQQLTGMKLEMAWLLTRARDGRMTDAESLDFLLGEVDKTLASVRRISTELRPPILDELGFEATLRWLAQETTKRSGLVVDLELPAAPLVADPQVATALFRIAQESLTNIVRHAHATRVLIRLVESDSRLVMTIRDDGRGTPADARDGGIGLVSMRERAMALGGDFSIIAVPGQGVTIDVVIPLVPPAAEGEET